MQSYYTVVIKQNVEAVNRKGCSARSGADVSYQLNYKSCVHVC